MQFDREEKFHLEHQSEDGTLTPEKMAQLLTGETETIEGDTPDNTEEIIDEPSVELKTGPETKVEVEVKPEAKPEPEPVVLAKDGVHTIEYSKLVEAREAAKHWEAVAAEKDALIESLKQAKIEDEKTGGTEAQDAVLENLFADFPELRQGMEKLVEARVSAIEAKVTEALKPLQATAEQTAAEAHFKSITAAHPDVDQILQGEDLAKWIETQPSFVRGHYNAILEKGTADQVIELFTAFKESNAQPAIPAKQDTSDDVARKAQEAVAKVKSGVPKSLSDIPAGSSAHHDEVGAMREMSGSALMEKFNGKTPDQIMELMSRVI